MIPALIIILVIVAVLLMLVVLAQNAKGGGFASNFSASNQLIGVKKTGDLLEKLTWGFAITLLTVSLAVNLVFESPAEEGQASPNLQTETVAPQIGNEGLEQAPADQGQGQSLPIDTGTK